MEGIWYEDGLNEALNRFEEVREEGETSGPIRIEIPSKIADTFEFDRLDGPVPDKGRPVLKTGDGNEYPLDFEGGQFVEPESKIPLGETEDGEMQILGGTAEIYSVRAAETDEEWPETRPNEEMFDAAFEDCVIDRAKDRDHGPSPEELVDNKYRIADAAYGDRLNLDDDLFVISVKDMHLPSKAIAEWVTDAITNIDEDIARYGRDEEGYAIGEALEVDEKDFHEMEDGTIMARAPNGKFLGKVESENHPISLYLDRDLGPEKEDDLRTFGSWLPYSREDGDHDKNVYSNFKIPIKSLTSDINTHWRDLKTGRPEGESRAASIPIEFNEGEKDDFSRESEDYMHVTIMQSDRHGPWYPVFTIPNEGDVERKLDVTEQVMGELSELQNLGQRDWSEINRYFPTELLSDLDTAHKQADFVDEALENGYLEAEEKKELHVNEDPSFVNRGVSNIKLKSGDEELELAYTDKSVGGSHHSEPSDRIHHNDFFKMMEWFEDKEVDIDYSVERSNEYEDQLVVDILSHAARSWEGRDDFREEAPKLQLLGQEKEFESEEDLGQIAHDAYRLRNQIMDEAIEKLNEEIVEALGERKSDESNYDLGELAEKADNYQTEMRYRPIPGHDMDGEYDLSTAAHASSTAADQLYELVEQHYKDSPEPAAE